MLRRWKKNDIVKFLTKQSLEFEEGELGYVSDIHENGAPLRIRRLDRVDRFLTVCNSFYEGDLEYTGETYIRKEYLANEICEMLTKESVDEKENYWFMKFDSFYQNKTLNKITFGFNKIMNKTPVSIKLNEKITEYYKYHVERGDDSEA